LTRIVALCLSLPTIEKTDQMLNTLRGALLATALLIGGCNTAPPAKIYTQDADLTVDSAATLTGSKVENPNALIGDVRLYVTHIDSARTHTGFGYPDQDKIFLVKPGTHYIGITLHRSMTFFNASSYYASTEQFVELEAGKAYVVRGELKNRNEAVIWIDEVGTTREQGRASARVWVPRPVVVPINVR
jgi:hypothetical protein